jgi:quinol monooxygenase YgiN
MRPHQREWLPRPRSRRDDVALGADVSVVRINEFDALADRRDDLRAVLSGILPTIREAEGCLSCLLLESEDAPGHFVIIEVWETRDHHGAAVSRIPTDTLRKTMTMLADVPKGGFYLDRT